MTSIYNQIVEHTNALNNSISAIDTKAALVDTKITELNTWRDGARAEYSRMSVMEEVDPTVTIPPLYTDQVQIDNYDVYAATTNNESAIYAPNNGSDCFVDFPYLNRMHDPATIGVGRGSYAGSYWNANYQSAYVDFHLVCRVGGGDWNVHNPTNIVIIHRTKDPAQFHFVDAPDKPLVALSMSDGVSYKHRVEGPPQNHGIPGFIRNSLELRMASGRAMSFFRIINLGPNTIQIGAWGWANLIR